MIKASELRPFNLVYRNGEVYEFNPADYCGTSDTGEVVFYNTTQFAPIPLNEEWLVKLGFFKPYGEPNMSGGVQWQCEEVEMMYTAKGNYHFSEGSEYIYGVPIQYVHQLQNLYHALTGEELQIK